MEKPPPGPGPLSFDEARERLRARGYLDRGVEGAVLRGALAARTRARAVVRASAVAAAILAAVLAAAETVALALRSTLGGRDAAVLFAWLLLGSALAAVVLVLALALVAWARSRGRTDPGGASTEVAVAFGLLIGVAGAFALRPALASASPAAAAGAFLAVGLAVFLAVRVARGVTLTVLLASGRSVLARRPGAATAAALVLAAAALGVALFAARREAPAPGGPLVVRGGTARVVVVAVDGWDDRFVAPSGPPAEPLAALLHAASLPYVKSSLDPAAFWTTVATAEPPDRHGVGALDLVRLAGVSAPVRPTGESGWYLGRVLPALGLARVESVTAAARRVPAMWEVARRGGLATLVVNWWTTYPAGPDATVVLSNHLFFAARAGSSLAGEGWPADAAARAAALAPRGVPSGGRVERLVADARGLDAFARAAFLAERDRLKPRLALLYLPGLDILGTALGEPGRSAGERVALASALVEEARDIRGFLAGEAAGGADLLAVFLDGGRARSEGTLLLAGPLANASATGSVRPEDVAPTLLRALGVPASAEVAGRVEPRLLAPAVADPGTVATWGRKTPDGAIPVDPRAYVENLRSLGYLR